MKNILNHLMMSAVLVAGIAGVSPSLKAADAPSPVAKVLAEAQTNASLISADWKSYARQPNLDWTNDAAEITRMKGDIDVVAKTIKSLNDARSQASPSQIATIDQIVPVMEELADNAADAVDYLNLNKTQLTSKECKEYLEDNSNTSKRLAGLIGQLVEFGNGRDKFENAKRMLEELEVAEQ